MEFRDEILLRGKNVKPRENPNFLKNGNFGQNLEFFYISDDETDFTVGIVSRNLAIILNFVEFLNSHNFHVFQGNGIVRGTLNILSGSKGATCHVQNLVKHELKCGHGWTYGIMSLEENPK